MLVVHANWTKSSLNLWAESLERYLQLIDYPHATLDTGRSATLATAAPPHAPPHAPPAAAVHPFVVPAQQLREALLALLPSHSILDDALGGEATLRLRLPCEEAQPRPSDRLASAAGAIEPDERPTLQRCTLPVVRLVSGRVLPALLALETAAVEGRVEFGHSLRYWIEVCRFIMELLLDQRFIPTLIQSHDAELRAAWQPWLHDEGARTRLSALLAGMPPVARAVVDEHGGRPWSILDDALRVLTDAAVRDALISEDFMEAIEGRERQTDPHVCWLSGLLDRRETISLRKDQATDLLRRTHGWIAGLEDSTRDRPLRLGMRLNEPREEGLAADDGAERSWRLSLHLCAAGREPTIIDAEDIWRDPNAVRARTGQLEQNPEEVLLAELGRAARLYSWLESALSDATPTGVDLTTGEAYTFLTDHRELLEECGFVIMVPPWWGQPSARLALRLDIQSPPLQGDPALLHGAAAASPARLGLNALVRYEWKVAIGDEAITFDEFQTLINQRTPLVKLRGRWVEIHPEQLADAAAMLESRPGGEMTLMQAIQLAHGAGERRYGLPVFGMDATGWVGDLLRASTGETRMTDLSQPEGFQGTLRPYQRVGLSWLWFLDELGLGACLADDMGLGKTIQLIALLLAEREHPRNGPVGPTLLVVPTSVISNWNRELNRFAPNLVIHIHHGADRPTGERLLCIAQECDVVITTYSLISRDRQSMMDVAWHRVVLDEAQYIKNPPTKQTSTIRALRTVRRIALTGTPVENRLSELWSIMEFCNPGYLGPAADFRRRFAIPIERHRDQHRAEQLRQMVRPFVLRRLKTDPKVISDLPACVTTREYSTLTPEQAAMYEGAVSRMLGEVSRSEGIQRRGLVLATLVKLKQICDHPALMEDKDASSFAEPEAPGLLSHRSGKTQRLVTMLEEVIATGDRALVFTQFRRMGHLLAAIIQHDLDSKVLFLHGGTPAAKRQEMIDRFQDPEGDVPVFVLSLKAGGLGLNLTAANHVFHFDRWWNPAVENQATDRAFRIGQTRNVHVHKFVCLGTLEERIDQMIEQKTELAQNIIGTGEDWLTELDTGQLRDLLTLREAAVEMDGENGSEEDS